MIKLRQQHTEEFLKWLWYGLLVFRFMVPIYDSPMGHLFSDPLRHWKNGINLLNPDIMGSIDPKLYQLYLFLVYHLSFDRPEAIAVFSGALCVAMAVVWYLACREIFSPLTARIIGCLIAACPSFTALYTLFINETLMLVLMGAATWTSLRSLNATTSPQRHRWRTAAICCWVLACYTRSMMIPLAGAFIWYLLYKIPQKRWQMAGFTLLITVLIALPAGWHSWQKLNVFAPFGFRQLNEFYFYTGSKNFEIDTEQGVYGFSSPSFYYPVGMPFFEYESCRIEQKITGYIDTRHGLRDWDSTLDKVKALYDWDKFWCGLRENFVFLIAGNSWPDSAVQWGYSWIYYLNFHLRWMWAPMMLMLLAKAPFVRRREEEHLILCCALGLMLLLLFQMTVMNEGRYRKPVEILLMLCCGILLAPRTETIKPEITLWQFIWQCYLQPIWQLIKIKPLALLPVLQQKR